ncbi:MAG: hypothetical protein Q9221_005853 [Calogaya cf. arnoldii]
MSDPQSSSSSSSASSRFTAWLAKNPPRVHSRRRSHSEVLTALHDTTHLRTSSPPPAKRRRVAQIKSAPVTPKSDPASGHLSLDRTPFDFTPPTKSPEASKPPRTRRKPLSYAKQRTNRITRIINATYAVCQGKPAESLAYPVHQIDTNRFYVPATFSDFQALQYYQHRSDASRATINFVRKPRLPDGTVFTPCISVNMVKREHEAMGPCVGEIITELEAARWTLPNNQPIEYIDTGAGRCWLTLGDGGKNQEPDGSITVQGASFPFLIVETANTQTESEIDDKVYNWIEGSRSHLRVILTFKLDFDSTPPRVLASLSKLRRVHQPLPNNPQHYVILKDSQFEGEEIYPALSSRTFTIQRQEVLPKGVINNTPAVAPVTISLRLFATTARKALSLRAAPPGQPLSARSSNQGEGPPPRPQTEWESSSEGSNNDRRGDDKTYHGKGKGKAVDPEGGRGVETRSSRYQ